MKLPILILVFMIHRTLMNENEKVMEAYNIIKSKEEKLGQMIDNLEADGADVLIEEVYQFTCMLWKLREQIYDRNEMYMGVGKLLFGYKKKSKQQRMPQILKKKLTDNMLRRYGWGERNIKHLKYLILDVEHLWESSKQIYDERINPRNLTLLTTTQDSVFLL